MFYIYIIPHCLTQHSSKSCLTCIRISHMNSGDGPQTQASAIRIAALLVCFPRDVTRRFNMFAHRYVVCSSERSAPRAPLRRALAICICALRVPKFVHHTSTVRSRASQIAHTHDDNNETNASRRRAFDVLCCARSYATCTHNTRQMF